jgi:hypothetical protein
MRHWILGLLTITGLGDELPPAVRADLDAVHSFLERHLGAILLQACSVGPANSDLLALALDCDWATGMASRGTGVLLASAGPWRRWRRRMGIAILSAAVVLLGTIVVVRTMCGIRKMAPEQEAFAPLEEMAAKQEAVVRVCACPVPYLDGFAMHPWFLAKRADSATFHRWEVWQTLWGEYGHVVRDRNPPMWDMRTGKAVVLAERVGPEAEEVITFIEAASPEYPCRNDYAYVPGPNSNTYAQWVLDATGWQVSLPPTAIGAGMVDECQEEENTELSGEGQ